MIRESLAANAANAFVTLTPGNGVTWQYRSSAGEDAYVKTPALPVPEIASSSMNPEKWLAPIPGATVAFKTHDAGPADGLTFRPLYELHHQRYSVYWRLREAGTAAGATLIPTNGYKTGL